MAVSPHPAKPVRAGAGARGRVRPGKHAREERAEGGEEGRGRGGEEGARREERDRVVCGWSRGRRAGDAARSPGAGRGQRSEVEGAGEEAGAGRCGRARAVEGSGARERGGHACAVPVISPPPSRGPGPGTPPPSSVGPACAALGDTPERAVRPHGPSPHGNRYPPQKAMRFPLPTAGRLHPFGYFFTHRDTSFQPGALARRGRGCLRRRFPSSAGPLTRTNARAGGARARSHEALFGHRAGTGMPERFSLATPTTAPPCSHVCPGGRRVGSGDGVRARRARAVREAVRPAPPGAGLRPRLQPRDGS